MSRYIDLDKILFFEGIDAETGEEIMLATMNQIEELPTADVAEVRHGEWITICTASLTGGLNWYMHSCSTCNYSYKTVVPKGYDYCPNCGAKMDGERREG